MDTRTILPNIRLKNCLETVYGTCNDGEGNRVSNNLQNRNVMYVCMDFFSLSTPAQHIVYMYAVLVFPLHIRALIR